MVKIGVIGAMEEEVSALRSKLDDVQVKTVAGIGFYYGQMFDKYIIVARSGIGKVNAAICAQILISVFQADKIINIGVAGGCGKDIEVKDLVISDDLVQHDFDTSAFGDPVGMIPRLGIQFFKADGYMAELAMQTSKELEAKAHFGRIASGDQFISDRAVKTRIVEMFSPLAVEMEGAAIAQVCELNNIPFLVIRSISDNSDNDSFIAFEEFIKSGAERSSALVVKMIENL